jgi:hypothetical protein
MIWQSRQFPAEVIEVKHKSACRHAHYRNKVLADLKIEKAAMEGERRTVEADLGPVRYLATLLGAENETVMRWFILAVALLLWLPSCYCWRRQDTIVSARRRVGRPRPATTTKLK